ncbi:hypothetical protein DFJ58DRAFT_917223 [Suillus subalutaceus]|uniref:uncharacterized protein n=1 Tax=Suillus subalutaceus TaxID=48586 RepID=UPI001B86C73B|nr:uncharacterized protein DFJ58DRAFT_917223 [Suillus subalutaceus]KAG1838295.1 hypothetical protein DFJ58DRAFT_917223 [Suillus subalutaceus]
MNMEGELLVDDVSNDELSLDKSDLLTMLLNNLSDSETSSSQASSPPDWSQLSSLWPQQPLDLSSDQNSKFPDLGGSFDFSFPMDLDLNAALSMAVDPSTLQYHGTSPQTMFDVNSLRIQPQDLLSSFPFTFSSPTLSSASASSSSADEKSPRMSISSGASVSPVMVPISSGTDPFSGVIMQAKLPIPRLISSIPALPSSKPPKHKQEPQPYLSSSASSSPSPGPTTPTSDSGSSAPNTQIAGAAVVSRPKTSHTTIERRYRTNLNARIQSLKASVPALRVLDQNTTQEGDVVDERGYIDGVKVARKGSKANVLGKAVEYIRVLKRREIRLRREQEGLRTLILGIPGAQPLLAEWDHEWAKKFGGPERDEIDNDAEAYEASDDEDGDGEDEGDDSERVRKKPKLTKAPAAKKDKQTAVSVAAVAPTSIPDGIPGAVPEKRKRGRPRKIQPGAPPPIVAAAPVLLSDPVSAPVQGDVTMQAQPQQYLLAVFALFSFFNSPFTSMGASHPHTHQGSVLSHVTDSTPVTAATMWSWSSAIQAIHLFASVLVLFTIVVPWLPLPGYVQRAKIMRLIPFSYLISSRALTAHEGAELLSPPLSPDISDSESDADSTTTERTTRQERGPLSNVLAQSGSQDERDALIDALGLSTGALGAVRSVFVKRMVNKASNSELERRAWVRLAELVALNPTSAPALLRLQVYLHLSSLLGASGKTTQHASDLATLALLAHSLPVFYVKDRSQRLWNRARAGLVRPYERLVLETLSLEEAAQTLTSSLPTTPLTPLGALATTLLRQRLHSHTSELFVQTVTRSHGGAHSQSHDAEQEAKWNETINAGRSLGGTTSAISDSFSKVWENGVLNVKDLVVDDDDIKTMLSTIVLFRRIFPSRIMCCDATDNEVSLILSPPPSPPARGPQKEVVMQLRRALGSSVFEEQSEDRDELEDSRDRAVDMLVEYERRGRSRV